MTKLIKLFFILHGLISILATCPDSPTYPSGVIPTTTPFQITPTTPGMTNFPTSTQQMTIMGTVTANEACTTKRVTPTSDTEKEVLTLYIDCTTLNYRVKGDWATGSYKTLYTTAADINSVSFVVSIDLATNQFKNEVETPKEASATFGSSSMTQSWSFDSTTKINVCSEKGGANPISCTISDFKIDYSYLGTGVTWMIGYVGGSTPSLAAAYPFVDGSLTNSLSSSTSDSAYFGDSLTSPTTGTSPSWDSSNAYVQLTQQGQFLTFPLPALQPMTVTTAYTLGVAAWIKIPSAPASEGTIFSTHSSDGTETGFKLTIKSFKQLGFYIGAVAATSVTSLPSITESSWQLIGFSINNRADSKTAFGTVFVGSSSAQVYRYNAATGIDTATLLRIGGATNSFVGDISAVRIMSPSGGYVRSSGTCSPLNSIELGTGSFPLTCSGSNPLNMMDGKCYTSCPATTISYTGSAVPLCAACPAKTYSTGTTCIDCPSHCATCDSTQCLTCDDNTYFVYNKACVNTCPAKMYSIGTTCENCPSHCATCDSTQCLTCDDNSYFVYNKACVNSCPAKMYSTGTTCTDCPTHCATCDSTQCLTCDDSNYFVYNKACVNSCPAKMYSTGTTCQNCPTHCATCDSTQCLTCDDSNYFVYNKACVNSCPAKMYSTGTTCQDCSDHCTECDASECKVCEDGYKVSEGKCVVPSSGGVSSVAASSKRISVGAIVGISCGSVVALTLLVLGLHLWKKKQILLAAKKTIGTSHKYLAGDESPIAGSPGPTETGQMLP